MQERDSGLPKMSEYTSAEAMNVRRRQQAAEQMQNREQYYRDIAANYEQVIRQNLPLLKKHVEMSPIEVPKSPRKPDKKLRLVGGWSIHHYMKKYTSWRHDGTDNYTPIHHHFVVTEEEQIGRTILIDDGRALRPSAGESLVDLSAEGLLPYIDRYTVPAHHSGLDLPLNTAVVEQNIKNQVNKNRR